MFSAQNQSDSPDLFGDDKYLFLSDMIVQIDCLTRDTKSETFSVPCAKRFWTPYCMPLQGALIGIELIARFSETCVSLSIAHFFYETIV